MCNVHQKYDRNFISKIDIKSNSHSLRFKTTQNFITIKLTSKVERDVQDKSN